VLVEVGPWPEEEKDKNLHRLGQRILDCITALTSRNLPKPASFAVVLNCENAICTTKFHIWNNFTRCGVASASSRSAEAPVAVGSGAVAGCFFELFWNRNKNQQLVEGVIPRCKKVISSK
jgi:hypothetical protein